MGKKKSKISKQKQAKAKQKQGKKTSMGGVAVSKGFSSKFHQQANKSSSSNLTIYRTNTTTNNNDERISDKRVFDGVGFHVVRVRTSDNKNGVCESVGKCGGSESRIPFVRCAIENQTVAPARPG